MSKKISKNTHEKIKTLTKNLNKMNQQLKFQIDTASVQSAPLIPISDSTAEMEQVIQ